MSILLRSLQNKCISTLQPSVEGLTAYRYGNTHIYYSSNNLMMQLVNNIDDRYLIM